MLQKIIRYFKNRDARKMSNISMANDPLLLNRSENPDFYIRCFDENRRHVDDVNKEMLNRLRAQDPVRLFETVKINKKKTVKGRKFSTGDIVRVIREGSDKSGDIVLKLDRVCSIGAVRKGKVQVDAINYDLSASMGEIILNKMLYWFDDTDFEIIKSVHIREYKILDKNIW
jgi:hypothetical protein